MAVQKYWKAGAKLYNVWMILIPVNVIYFEVEYFQKRIKYEINKMYFKINDIVLVLNNIIKFNIFYIKIIMTSSIFQNVLDKLFR